MSPIAVIAGAIATVLGGRLFGVIQIDLNVAAVLVAAGTIVGAFVSGRRLRAERPKIVQEAGNFAAQAAEKLVSAYAKDNERLRVQLDAALARIAHLEAVLRRHGLNGDDVA